MQVESLRFDRRGNLLATYNNGVRWVQQSDRLLPPCTSIAHSCPQARERPMLLRTTAEQSPQVLPAPAPHSSVCSLALRRSYWDFTRTEDEKQELPLPAPGAMLCGDVTPSAYLTAHCCTWHIACHAYTYSSPLWQQAVPALAAT